MILSFHPCYEADANILCAGRQPDDTDLAAIRRADAVVLPQGCRWSLYHMARTHCPHVFPNYDARFDFPGKTGQAKLFASVGAPHPRTWIFTDTDQFQKESAQLTTHGYPLVFKLDWGGQGETVFLLKTPSDLSAALSTAAAYERTGQRGFVVQAYVKHASRTLRVAVIGQTLTAYWRVQERPTDFGCSLASGARIDTDASPRLRRQATALVRRFCQRTRINLAGFDIIFDESNDTANTPQALFLEINFFFGRTGLGGSARYYTLLQAEIEQWLTGMGLMQHRTRKPSSPTEKP